MGKFDGKSNTKKKNISKEILRVRRDLFDQK